MSIPVITFFNNKGGVGKTSLAYHLAWKFSELGRRVVAIDLDPQANLTAAFLDEETLERIWDSETASSRADTIHQCVRPLSRTSDVREAKTIKITSNLRLIPGDLGLAAFEDLLSQEWGYSNSRDSDTKFRAMRVLTAFWQVAQAAAEKHEADLILADVGPNLGAINRSVLIGTDYVVIPLAADLYSLQGLRNLGPTLRKWRQEWNDRTAHWPANEFSLPTGRMTPLGYVVLQHAERLSRPVKSYQRWLKRIPEVYRESVLDLPNSLLDEATDPHCLARLKHYRSLVPMAQEARKPIFYLTAADGAIGNHSYAVQEASADFARLGNTILSRIDAQSSANA